MTTSRTTHRKISVAELDRFIAKLDDEARTYVAHRLVEALGHTRPPKGGSEARNAPVSSTEVHAVGFEKGGRIGKRRLSPTRIIRGHTKVQAVVVDEELDKLTAVEEAEEDAVDALFAASAKRDAESGALDRLRETVQKEVKAGRFRPL